MALHRLHRAVFATFAVRAPLLARRTPNFTLKEPMQVVENPGAMAARNAVARLP